MTSLTGLWLLTDSWNPLWPLLWASAVLPVPVSVLLALSYPVGRSAVGSDGPSRRSRSARSSSLACDS